MENSCLKPHFYKPYQPGFEKKINYKNFVIPINHPLFGIVSDFYQFESNTTINNEICVIPDGCIDLLFTYTEEGVSKTVEGFYREKIIVPISITGCAFGVRFFPGSITNILKINTSELIGKQIPLMDLLSSDYDLEKMKETSNFNDRIVLMTNYILKKINKVYDSSKVVHYCTKKIISFGGNISISELASETSYTIRYLREIFHKHVGVSPKELCDIIKFQNSFAILSKFQNDNIALSMSNFAIQSGYYDQSHMNKSYKKIAGSLPKKLYIEMFSQKNH
jgi:AraC-like DNA-binding protein